MSSLPQSESPAEIVIYQPDIHTSIPFRREDDETLGTQKEIAKLFNISIPSVNGHIRNFRTSDPDTYSKGIRNFRITAGDGKSYDVEHYNLDIIVYIGYRAQATTETVAFRRWVASLVKREVSNVPVTALDNFRAILDTFTEQQRQIDDIYGVLGSQHQDIESIKGQLDREGYYTVKVYCKMHGLPRTTALVQQYGKRARALSLERGLDILEAPDPVYEKVGKYHESVLSEVCRPKPASGQLSLLDGSR